MKSALPKVLHPLCGRPMLAYVLDAWDEAAAADGAPTRPVVVYSPAVAAVRTPSPSEPTSRSRTSRAAPATRSARP